MANLGKGLRHSTAGALGVMLVALATLIAAGCSQALGKAGREVMGKSLDAVNAPENRAKIEQLLTSPEARTITRELTGEVVDTALADLTGEERQARLHALAVQFVERLVPVVADALSTQIWPELEQALVAGVEKALDQALSPEARAKARELAAEVARGAMEATAPQISAAIAQGVAAGVEESVRAVLEEQLGPALETLLAGDPPLVRRLTREAAHGVLLGIADAMEPEGQGFDAVWDRERDEIIARVGGEVGRQQEALTRKFKTWVFILAPLALLLLVLSVFLFVRLRRVRRQVEA